jgi:hypothetical protein
LLLNYNFIEHILNAYHRYNNLNVNLDIESTI